MLGACRCSDHYSSTLNKQRKKKSSVSYGFMSSPFHNWDQISPTRLLPFCVPEDESEDRIIEAVSRQLSLKIDTEKILRDRIFKTLKAEYSVGNPN